MPKPAFYAWQIESSPGAQCEMQCSPQKTMHFAEVTRLVQPTLIEKNQRMLMQLRKSNHPTIQQVVAMMDESNAGLEQSPLNPPEY